MKHKSIFFIILFTCIILFNIESNAISTEKVEDFKNPAFSVKEISTKDDFVYIHLNWIDDCSKYTYTITNHLQGTDYTTTCDKYKRGFKIKKDVTEVTFKSKDGSFEKKYVIKIHEHNFVSNTIHPTTTENGVEFNTCTDCDAIYKVKDIEKLQAITLKIESGISKTKLYWNTAGEIDGYEIWKKVGTGSYKKLKTTKSLGELVTLSTTTNYYKVRGYIYDNGNYYYTDFSNEIKLKKTTQKVTLSLNKKTVNNYSYSLVTYNKVQLKWNTFADVKYYKIYKYNTSKKKYELIKTINDYKTNKYSVTGLSSSKTYKFKLVAYDTMGKKVTSNVLSVTTKNKTDGYFYDKCIWYNTWDNILITSKQASSTTMNKYKVNNTKPFVKYNYSTNNDTLYIHIYGDFEGSGVNKKFTTYKLTINNGYHYKLKKTYSTTYKQLVTDTVKSYFNLSIKGNSYDFMTGCNFKTKVIFHTNITDPEQHKTMFKIGTPKIGYDYWFCAEGNSKGDYGVVLPTQQQLATNKTIAMPRNNITAYKKTVAHELGHNLGLADAYNYTDSKHKVARTIKNTETGYFVGSQYFNIMYGGDTAKVVKNDIEMMIQAQAESTDAKTVQQYYKTHNTYDQNGNPLKNIKSVVIRK